MKLKSLLCHLLHLTEGWSHRITYTIALLAAAFVGALPASMLTSHTDISQKFSILYLKKSYQYKMN